MKRKKNSAQKVCELSAAIMSYDLQDYSIVNLAFPEES